MSFFALRKLIQFDQLCLLVFLLLSLLLCAQLESRTAPRPCQGRFNPWSFLVSLFSLEIFSLNCFLSSEAFEQTHLHWHGSVTHLEPSKKECSHLLWLFWLWNISLKKMCWPKTAHAAEHSLTIQGGKGWRQLWDGNVNTAEPIAGKASSHHSAGNVMDAVFYEKANSCATIMDISILA